MLVHCLLTVCDPLEKGGLIDKWVGTEFEFDIIIFKKRFADMIFLYFTARKMLIKKTHSLFIITT